MARSGPTSRVSRISSTTTSATALLGSGPSIGGRSLVDGANWQRISLTQPPFTSLHEQLDIDEG